MNRIRDLIFNQEFRKIVRDMADTTAYTITFMTAWKAIKEPEKCPQISLVDNKSTCV